MKKLDDAQAGGGTAPGEGQQGGIRRRDETTHILVEEQRRGRVSRVEFGDATRRRTNWWRNSARGGSAKHFLKYEPRNVHTEDHNAPHEYQRCVIPRMNHVTYKLSTA